ncbi:unnamed protein product [Heterobilharzia americana]|nr:unnamed protein product [Heterobilharzia americana]
MGVIKCVLSFPLSVRVRTLAFQLSSQIEQACCQPNSSLTRFVLSTHRAVIANLLLCRHSGTLIIRRLRDKYWSIRTDSRSFVTQKVLLGASLISFAQDKITDEEVLITLESFSTKNGDSSDPNNSRSFSVVETDTKEEPLPSPSIEHSVNNQSCESWDPPLTLMIRQLRHNYLKQMPVFSSPNLDLVPSTDSDLPLCNSDHHHHHHLNEVSNVDHFTTSLLSFFANLNIQPDGTGFVDDSWDLVFDRPSIRVWRRPVKVSMYNNEGNCSKPSNKYEYRVCGQFHDISASSFLEVQLNLDYRRNWDDKIVKLDYITPSDVHNGDFSIIRWVVRFPFPLVNREYIYMRRWWMQPDEFHLNTEKSLSLLHQHEDKSAASVVLCRNDATEKHKSLSRYAYVISRCSPDYQEKYSQSSDGFPVESSKKSGSWTSMTKRDLVQVHEYHSEMLIQSHGKFNETGLNYYLIYYDDPCLPVNGSPMKLFSIKAMEEFMSQLHKAALRLHAEGLPPGIHPIVYDENKVEDKRKSKVLSELEAKPPPTNKQPDDNNNKKKKQAKSYFFTDPPPSEASYFDSSTGALY